MKARGFPGTKKNIALFGVHPCHEALHHLRWSWTRGRRCKAGDGSSYRMNLPYDRGFIYSHPAIPAMTLGTIRVPGFWLITTWFKHVELAIHGIFMHFSRFFHIFNLIGFTMKHSKSFVWWTIKLVDRQEDGIFFLMGRNEELRFFEPSTRFCWENHKI